MTVVRLVLILSKDLKYGKFWVLFRRMASTRASNSGELRCAIDHILEAEKKGEINEDNVLYIVENINVAGTFHIY